MRVGDWTCSSCKGIVFSHKTKCRCGQEKSNNDTPKTLSPRIGDWTCSSCKGIVFSHKTKCRCGQEKSNNDTPKTFSVSFGDWKCECGTYNKRLNENCFKCKKVPSELESERVDDSTCLICMKTRRQCAVIPCGHFVMCYECSKKIPDRCPKCRGNIDKMLKIYH
uniref:RING-type domain-containing protein n=1 Tax=viral metagenome TaxID=1070528 RepID=A0A6C0JBA6_9ZZZZ